MSARATNSMDANIEINTLAEATNKLVSDGGSSGASWAALRADLREYYDVGDVIEDPSDLVEEIDRINNQLYAENGLEALVDSGVVERSQEGYKLTE